MGFNRAITALIASSVTLATPQLNNSQCTMIDAGIRKDCGIEAAGNDNVVTKAECLEIGCCWDTTTYNTVNGDEIESPWCFFPLYYNYQDEISNDVIEPTSTSTPTTTSTTPLSSTTRIEVEEIIIEKVVIEKFTKPTSTASVLKPISNKATLHSHTLPNTVNTPSNKAPQPDHGDLVTAYRKKTCQQLEGSKSLNSTMKALTMDRMKCDTVDFANFDASKDPNLNQDTAEGMRVLLDK